MPDSYVYFGKEISFPDARSGLLVRSDRITQISKSSFIRCHIHQDARQPPPHLNFVPRQMPLASRH
jgi:hypothetical protein